MQVRLIVAVLKCVGTGELTVLDGIFLSLSLVRVIYSNGFKNIEQKGLLYDLLSVERILKAKDVSASKPMAPASGLYLARVKYEFP